MAVGLPRLAEVDIGLGAEVGAYTLGEVAFVPFVEHTWADHLEAAYQVDMA